MLHRGSDRNPLRNDFYGNGKSIENVYFVFFWGNRNILPIVLIIVLIIFTIVLMEKYYAVTNTL